MKHQIFLLFMLTVPGFIFAQDKKDNDKKAFKSSENTLTCKVDGETFEANPRKVKFGRVVYYTGNVSKPETMLRVWLGTFDKSETEKSGNYLILSDKNPPTKKEIKEKKYEDNYAGIAYVRYVLETKTPRMKYHVGDSQNKEEVMTVKNTGDGFLEISFNAELAGTHWKEKDFNTVVGGLGRLKGKMEDKMLSNATGFDWNLDPEGNGYRRLKEEDDTIKLTDVKMVIKLKE